MAEHSRNPSDDPRLSAYLFDEMAPDERVRFEEELRASEALQEALVELRQVSSLMGRVFAHEPVPGGNQTPARGPFTSSGVAERKLSRRARAGRVARYRQDIPKINTSLRNRSTALVGAIAAAVVLAGLVTLQSVFDATTRRDEAAVYIPLTTTKQGDYAVAIPLSEEIADHIAAESAAYEAELSTVSDEVFLGLAEALDATPSLFADRAPGRVVSKELPVAQRVRAVPPAEIALSSAFAMQTERETSSGRARGGSPRVMLENDQGASIASAFQSTLDFKSSRIPLHVSANDLGVLQQQIEGSRTVSSADVSIPGLLNAFDYSRLESVETDQESPFELELEVAETPWNRLHYLVRLTIETSEKEPEMAKASEPLANDVKLDVKFNPEQIAAFRLIGYEPEVVTSKEIFSQPGEPLPHGYQLTVLYEVIPVGHPVPPATKRADDRFEVAVVLGKGGQRGTELLRATIGYMLPEAGERVSINKGLSMPMVVPSWHGASRAFQWAAAVASFGMEILDDPLLTGADWELIEALARSAAGDEKDGQYLKFISMIESAKALE